MVVDTLSMHDGPMPFEAIVSHTGLTAQETKRAIGELKKGAMIRRTKGDWVLKGRVR